MLPEHTSPGVKISCNNEIRILIFCMFETINNISDSMTSTVGRALRFEVVINYAHNDGIDR